ncbi:methyltransferase domain-containing protein [Nocardia cyriacigeorgica]|uniref:class I SAM-dependent methyltransferase n=1 Tax=Nocardia cyriacigeorgica TaxID=135487 RepID=UPI0018930E57|nr:class I SAM-dependent methyltransferase [Nocardia cyriacigeorgica]MBF6099949.1 methyltransferase domain-containing protein [Nocardia cyriacigeorgica]MBF6159706.1 methyltransferase domain-containing protein [Nocardia cyriacigeorgica]MBF6198789.1 methyltransferase domain-containing protein [Nocardia cyriacigeorgica]MBF6316049.1 methyltransferase domain-containing protein [Nocardia cyriacigeorgica]MBF6342408.1 methyltransferase domain-containing protein [Nocardia cyriacigeorgica]
MNLARRTMNNPALAAVYERAWRPALFYLASGQTTEADRRFAAESLRLRKARRVLDIACGPGNFTRYLSDQLPGDGYAVGVDYSPPMLARAVADNSGPRVGYLRGDARFLPFPDGSFDAVCCFGALYLIPDPLAAAREMIRVLAPGGRIAITTSHRDDSAFGHATRIVGGWSGLRVFDTETFPSLFAEQGLVEIDQEIHRLLQYVSATRPG